MITYWIPQLYRPIMIQLREAYREDYNFTIVKNEDFKGYDLNICDKHGKRVSIISIPKKDLIPEDKLKVYLIKEDTFKIKDSHCKTILDLIELSDSITDISLKWDIKGFYYKDYGLSYFECCNKLYSIELFDQIMSLNSCLLKYYDLSEVDSMLSEIICYFASDINDMKNKINFSLLDYEDILNKAVVNNSNLCDAISDICFNIMKTNEEIKPLHRLFSLVVILRDSMKDIKKSN